MVLYAAPSDVVFSDPNHEITRGVWYLLEIHMVAGPHGSLAARVDGVDLALEHEAGTPGLTPDDVDTGPGFNYIKLDTTYNDYAFAIDNGATLLDEANARNVLLQVMGQPRTLMFRVERISVCPGDTLLLCTDGLSGCVDDAEIERTITDAPSINVGTEALISLANSKGGHDNVTVVLARVEPTARP